MCSTSVQSNVLVHCIKLENTIQEVLGFLQNNQRPSRTYENRLITSEWPTFDWKKDSDCVKFLIKIDAFKLFYDKPDEEGNHKLISILTDVTGVWCQAVLPSHPDLSWEHCKQMINHKFGGHTCRNKKLQLFEAERCVTTEEPYSFGGYLKGYPLFVLTYLLKILEPKSFWKFLSNWEIWWQIRVLMLWISLNSFLRRMNVK